MVGFASGFFLKKNPEQIGVVAAVAIVHFSHSHSFTMYIGVAAVGTPSY